MSRIPFVAMAMLAAAPFSGLADCAVTAVRVGKEPKNPVYEVLGCSSAKAVIDERRMAEPNWYGDITYQESDVAIHVTYANEDARILLNWSYSEYWYSPNGCSSFPAGKLLSLNAANMESRCCDIGPVRDVQCGLGGKRLLE